MTDAADDSHRVRRIRLANMRQELLAPVSAIVGYGELLEEGAARDSADEIIPDLERIVHAARELSDTVDRLFDTEVAQGLFEGSDIAEVQKKLRHDLRTPLNAIKGYGEMLLEDLDDLGGEALRPDFMKLLAEADRLLSQIDSIVDFSRTELAGPVGDPGRSQAAAMFAELARSIRPVGEDQPRAMESGYILVVDDIETNRELLSRRLGRAGHRVAVAEGGRQALRMMQTENFDLVLLDLMMPEMNGFEVLSHLKADRRLHEVPVIMISALDETDSVIRCIEAGAEDYLPKPFDPVLLKARISACLEKKQWRDRERMYLDRLETEKEKYERLLLNILPRQVVGRLNDGESVIADRFDQVTVLFADLVGFTGLSARLPPSQLVEYLNHLFSEFDILARDLAVEKIKTIGDAYMVVAGLPEPRSDHAEAVARMGLGMIDTLERVNRAVANPLGIRIGIHSGPVVAGIIGTHRFVYDVWGDTVNLASRLEAHGLPNRIQISEATADLLARGFDLEPRGSIEVKGKGRLKTFFLNGAKG
ncbi:MAG: adenylate/guanylate cyclase domain-containing protein [Kiloniellales bacterium]